jgi:rhamnogalacturonan hydrolase
MIFIEHTTDFEMFSSTSAGAVQGYGYTFHAGKILDFDMLQKRLADCWVYSWNIWTPYSSTV